MSVPSRRIYVVAGEESGDALGGALVAALRRLSPEPLQIAGLGGERMKEQGIDPPFALDDVAVMGAFAIMRHLPLLYRRAYDVIEHAERFRPDVIVIIDSPEFTHPIAKRLRKRLPSVPILDYVSPSVWAWRSGRARRMLRYVDEVLALLPFEPAAYKTLGGPLCTYVGHPLIESAQALRADRNNPSGDDNRVLVLPGSRKSEVTRLMPIFRDCVEALSAAHPELRFALPAADAQVARIEGLLADWRVKPNIVRGRADREAAMRGARAAIAASGTVTLELALARVPMVVCYRIDWLIARFRHLLRAHSVVLPNLIAGGNDIPELIHTDCTVDRIVATVLPLLAEDSPPRQTQTAAFDRVESAMNFTGPPPSDRAAVRVLHHLGLGDQVQRSFSAT